MSLDTQDKEWIHSTINMAVDRSHRKFRKETELHINLLMEKYEHDMKGMRELYSIHPTREEVWEMIYEDGRKRQAQLDLFREEMAALRRDHNAHVMACA